MVQYFRCAMCDKLVSRIPSSYKPKCGKFFCSRDCWHLYMRQTTAKKLHYCEFCGKPFFAYKKFHRRYCSQGCTKKAQTLPRLQDNRLIEYCYKLVGESFINRIIGYRARKTDLHNELRFVAIDTIQKFLVSDKFKYLLSNYIGKALDGHIKRVYNENKRQRKLLEKYIGGRTYDEITALEQKDVK